MKLFDNELVYYPKLKVRRKICNHIGYDLYTRVVIYFEQAGIYNEFETGFVVDNLDGLL